MNICWIKNYKIKVVILKLDLNIDLSCNFVDIYMDKLRDLGKSLDKKNQTVYDMEDMGISENHYGIPSVKNLKKISILSINDIYDLL